ncbi:CDP-glycerol glycerophosphotransferase family protein [Oceanobacillus sp. J11TS1]|uniref:CDP-glycerol glycerophosphotransferase family protein n=1 Tax=Oceanobacillus sp. J11TS1 TaxID=2807191 RepID=UPI001B2D96D8|nr:CDP-glycerol glycerophosphotransferase family protein [Oceanobacillus sp. J11TS1]GIO23405.1 hypothetical protein J11TS1_19860 [Oceanobacillus sp. J11TS1]
MKKAPRGKLKTSVRYFQKGKLFYVEGEFNRENFKAKELWLFTRSHEVKIKVSEINPANKFTFEINLESLIQDLNSNLAENYDWYFKVTTPLKSVPAARRKSSDLEIIEIDGMQFAEYFIRCGRFEHTKAEGLQYYHYSENRVLNYITIKGNLSLVYNIEPDAPTKLQIDKIKKRRSKLIMEGKLFTRNSRILKGELLLQGRETRMNYSIKNVKFTHLTDQVEKKYGLNRYTYQVEIDFKGLNGAKPIEEDIYDVFFSLEMHDLDEVKNVRVGRPTFRTKLFLRDVDAPLKEESNIIHPYLTFKKQNLSFEVYKYRTDIYKYLKRVMRWSWLIRLLHKKEDNWIVGERTYKAQDTGKAFFEYMRGKHPDKNVYYVIEADSPERKNVEQLGNVLEYKSKEHILKTIISTKVISSHHPDYLYPIRTNKFKNKVKADKVFLQHGIMGTKNMIANYGKNSPGFDTDFFIVSSDFEKQMIVNDFGYKPSSVFVTGLSRFDSLFKKDVEVKRQLLIIPTWRDWIVTDDDFLESEYYQRYTDLINSERLKELAETNNFNILFCLHPNMQRFSSHFENDHIKVVKQGEIDVQFLIKQSAMMLTDYSSVGFDFSFLDKPVLYYQFDRNRFIGKRPSHLDLDNELPGEIAFDYEKVMDSIEKYAKSDFQIEEEYHLKASKFVKHRDLNSSQRIYEHVKEAKAKKSIFNNNKVQMINGAVYRKFRKSKYYFPLMKKLYKVAYYIIPTDPKLILFESGIGKQFSDSPRVIYEEIIKNDLDYKKVWVYNKNYRFSDEKTIKISRLSPAYYYYLLRAGYWVNNQNFPTYIKKPSKTTYLQTWHGTPLKKMLYDIENIQGRSDDYLERVGSAVKQWDYLISPSAYATDKFRSAFRYEGEVLEVGYPRNDILFSDNAKEIGSKVKKRLKLPEDKKVILYAPTFRDDQTSKKNKFLFDINMDLNLMKEKLGDDYIILLRMHVVVSNKLKIDPELKDFVKNVSNYPDIQDLYLITDILITDYSSVMFDFANTQKPILFYTYDFEKYRDDLRGFYMDFESEAPGPFVYSTNEIIYSIENIEEMEATYKDKYKKFSQKYCSLDDGNAGKRVVDNIFK